MGSSPGSRSSLYIVLWIGVLHIFLFSVGGSGALRDVDIVLPRYVRRGDDVRLTCNYNQERDQIYAVNWYRAGERKKAQEFYRYVPKEVPPQKAFQLPGFQVDVRRSTDHEVYLRNVSLDISGLYKCSVTAEQTFQTLSSTNEMTVVVIGEDSPSVHLDRAQYHPGDPVTVECQSPYSFPPANITWFYNETEVGPSSGNVGGVAGVAHFEVKTDYQKSPLDSVTQSTLSRLSFDLPVPDKFPPNVGAVTIKCRVTLFTLYDQNSTIQTIAPIPRRLTGTDTLLRQGLNTSSSSHLCDSALQYVVRFLALLLVSSWLTSPQIMAGFTNTATEVQARSTSTSPTSIFSWRKQTQMPALLAVISAASRITAYSKAKAAFSTFSLNCPVEWLVCPVYTLLSLTVLLRSLLPSTPKDYQTSKVYFH